MPELLRRELSSWLVHGLRVSPVLTALPSFVGVLAVCFALPFLGGAGGARQTKDDAVRAQSVEDDIALAVLRDSRNRWILEGIILPPEKVARSFIQLIAHPQEYAGAKVRLDGFLEMEGSDGQLRMNKEDRSNVLRVRLGPCRSGQSRDGGSFDLNQALIEVGYRGGDVRISGFFEPPDKYAAAYGDFGAICGVTELVAYR